MAHSLVPKYYSNVWLQGGNNGVQQLSPHEDQEVSLNRSKCFERFFRNPNDLRKVYVEYGTFSSGLGYFNQPHVINARMHVEEVRHVIMGLFSVSGDMLAPGTEHRARRGKIKQSLGSRGMSGIYSL